MYEYPNPCPYWVGRGKLGLSLGLSSMRSLALYLAEFFDNSVMFRMVELDKMRDSVLDYRFQALILKPEG